VATRVRGPRRAAVRTVGRLVAPRAFELIEVLPDLADLGSRFALQRAGVDAVQCLLRFVEMELR